MGGGAEMEKKKKLERTSKLVYNFGYLTIMPVNARDKQGQAETSRDKAGTNKD